ncbi:MAG TPA: nitroreductase/quinone reductase family protein [Candidatus Limnocylindrales bacterium]|nr:nitroreductase/quinone reductase family protein [Candidatus Limnocylindrales bacterium]
MDRRLPRVVYLAFGEIGVNRRFTRFHRWLLRRTGGGRAIDRVLGLDIILVTTKGRRTGEPRTVPLGAVRHGGDWLVIGSSAGQDRMPAWALNLRSEPAVTVEWRGETRHFRAHEATGLEAETLWPVVLRVYPGYADYQARTDRAIPLVVLEPA